MKVILLAATGGEPIYRHYPICSSKPKHLYHYGGYVVLELLINRLIKAGFQQKDIEIVAGFKYQKIVDFLEEKKFNIKVKVNRNWKKSSAYTLDKAMEGVNEDFILMYGDDIRKQEFYDELISHKCKTLVYGGGYGFGGKFSKEYIPVVKGLVNRYKDAKRVKYEDGKKYFLGMSTGCAIAGIFSQIEKELREHYGYDPQKANIDPRYVADMDDFFDTDEYKSYHPLFRVFYFYTYWVLSLIRGAFFRTSNNIRLSFHLLKEQF